MAEVGIHFEDVAIVMLQRPLETCDIGRSKAQFTTAFQYEETIGKLLLCHHTLHDGCGTVRRPVIDDQDMKTLLQAEHGTDNFLDILLFVIRRNNYNTVTCVHNNVFFLICLQNYEIIMNYAL